MKIFEVFKKPQNVFLVFALFFGTLFALLSPPFQAPDEPAHFYKMYGYTNFSYSFKVLNSKYGQILPVNLTKTADSFLRAAFFTQVKFEKEEVIKSLSVKLEKEKTSFHNFVPSPYTPFSYFPAFFILWIMKLLNVNPIWMLYILRLCSLFLYTGLVYQAIRTVPVKKWLFFTIAVLPMPLYISAAVNTDGLIIGLSFLFIAYALKFAIDKNIKNFGKKEALIFGLLFTWIILCKYAYLPLILMLFMIPSEKFSSKKFRNIYFWILLITNMIITAAVSLYSVVLGRNIEPLSRATDYLSPVYTLNWLFHHPLMFLQFVFLTIYKNTNMYIETLIGRFGWLDTGLPNFIIFSYVILLIIAAVFNAPKEENAVYTFKMKLIGLSIYALSFFITLTSVFILFAYHPIIEGIQGRYLLPIFPLLCLFFKTDRLNYKFLPLFLTVSSAFLLYGSILVLCARYYY